MIHQVFVFPTGLCMSHQQQVFQGNLPFLWRTVSGLSATTSATLLPPATLVVRSGAWDSLVD